MNISLRIGDCTVDTATDTSTPFVQVRPYNAVTVLCESIIHLAVDRAATTGDFKLLANTYIVIDIIEDETLNFILADGEADGEIRLTATLT